MQDLFLCLQRGWDGGRSQSELSLYRGGNPVGGSPSSFRQRDLGPRFKAVSNLTYSSKEEKRSPGFRLWSSGPNFDTELPQVIT